MSRFPQKTMDDDARPPNGPEAPEGQEGADLWFLPAPIADDPDDPPPGPAPVAQKPDAVAAWRAAEAGQAAQLARVAARLGILDERLRRGPAGWQQRLALIEAADLSWRRQERIGLDRVALYMALRVSAATDDAQALYGIGWAVRRLSGGPGPLAPQAGVGALAAFLDRRDRPGLRSQGAERPAHDSLADRAAGWLAMMDRAEDLHPVTRACMGFHLWPVAARAPVDDLLEPAVTAARIAIAGLAPSGSPPGAIFAPIAMGGGGGLRAIGDPPARLACWLSAMERATLAALRRLEEIEAWAAGAAQAMAPLSGRTPPLLRALFTSWPLVSVQMAERLTGAHRATVQRNIAWMEAQGLIREVTGQGRYRMWRIVEPRATKASPTPDRNDAPTPKDPLDLLPPRP